VFFYAGERALLVSHWEVDSAATVKLITTAVGALARDTSLGCAKALRHAMLYVMALAHKLDAGRPSVRVGTIRGCGLGRWAMRLRRPLEWPIALLQICDRISD